MQTPKPETTKSFSLTHEQIVEIMPHQDPFLFLDEATIHKDSAVGSYKITGDEYFLKGHFKQQPVFPASIMIEAVGQLGVLFLLTSNSLGLPYPIDNDKIMFTRCDECRCHTLCQPGDTLTLKLKLEKVRAPFIKFEDCLVSKGGEKVFRTNGISLVFGFKK